MVAPDITDLTVLSSSSSSAFLAFERRDGVDRLYIDCTVKFMRILRAASDLWRTFAARHDVSYIYMSQRDLQGFASDPELKNSCNCMVGRL